MSMLRECGARLIREGICRHLLVRVGRGKEVLMEERMSTDALPLDENTLFDMASVTKIVCTTTLALLAMEQGRLSPEDQVSRFFVVPPAKSAMTVRHLLNHTMGIGHKSLVAADNTCDNIAAYILAIPSDVPIGSEVLYSCPGFVLLGKILEQVFDLPLNVAFDRYVAKPLGLASTGFLPDRGRAIVNANPTEAERGVVNDYNCRHLGGVAGNAGLFSTLSDMTRYVEWLQGRGEPLLSRDTFDAAVQNGTARLSASRALGFLYVDDRYRQTGGQFAEGSIGHCGHTGQSVFVDLRDGFYVIILSDATAAVTEKYGKGHYDKVMDMRHDLHAAIKADLN